MKHNELDSLHIQRIAAWMWLGYLAVMALVDAIIYANLSNQPIVLYSWANGLAALLFLGLSYWAWGQERLGKAYSPLMILFISATPILLHHLLLPQLPPGPLSNAEGIIMRQLPVHFIGLILAAWQYRFGAIVLFGLGTAVLDFLIIILFKQVNPGTLTVILFITIIRTVSFLVIGVFINRLIVHLRTQQGSLQQANLQLRHHASALENLTVSRERNRMARELHDTLAHTLSGLAVQLETVKAYWSVEPDTAQKLLNQSLAVTRSGLDETRRALKALRATPLEDLGLRLAMQKLAKSAMLRAGFKLDLALPEQIPELSPDVEQCLYRVAQEAIENVVHHANAQNLMVSLSFNGADALLAVQDDGLGFKVEQGASPGHYGLSGMQERAQLVGGELTIESHLGKGSIVKLALKGHSHESNNL
ncbi:MAG: sensor histidine kinase [Chloroflexi bacterium]|nr:sensor histidine kinase [Chloroflexota bacterium]